MPLDEASVVDVVVACRRILDFRGALDFAAFRADIKTQSAIVHQILVIGEATKRLSDAFRGAHPSVPWDDIAGMRDRLIHGYDTVDVKRVWQVVESHVPVLLAYLEPLTRKP